MASFSTLIPAMGLLPEWHEKQNWEKSGGAVGATAAVGAGWAAVVAAVGRVGVPGAAIRATAQAPRAAATKRPRDVMWKRFRFGVVMKISTLLYVDDMSMSKGFWWRVELTFGSG